eukprot:15433400-Alexandrium_andersonii.AAC.1
MGAAICWRCRGALVRRSQSLWICALCVNQRLSICGAPLGLVAAVRSLGVPAPLSRHLAGGSRGGSGLQRRARGQLPHRWMRRVGAHTTR